MGNHKNLVLTTEWNLESGPVLYSLPIERTVTHPDCVRLLKHATLNYDIISHIILKVLIRDRNSLYKWKNLMHLENKTNNVSKNQTSTNSWGDYPSHTQAWKLVQQTRDREYSIGQWDPFKSTTPIIIKEISFDSHLQRNNHIETMKLLVVTNM